MTINIGYCEDCGWRDKEGCCANENKLHEEFCGDEEGTDDHLVYSYNEGGGFWVGPKFGCVHFKKDKTP